MKVKEDSEKFGLKLNIQKTKIMASDPITSKQIDWETVETVADFIFGGSKITADGDCSHEFKRHLLLGRKVTTNLDSIFKSRDITLPAKVHLVKALVYFHFLEANFQNYGRLGDCSHKIKRCLLLGRKVMTNLDRIFKSRDITLPTKVRLVKAIVFSLGHIWM